MNFKNYKIFGILLISLCLIVFSVFQLKSSNDFPDKLHLLSLLQNKQYELLDKILMSYQEQYESNKTNEAVLAFAYSAFSSVDPELESLLTEWVNQSPDSYSANLSRGIYYYNLGFEYRGFRFRRKTKDKQISKMHEYMNKAFSDLIKATELTSKSTLAYSYMINVSATSGSLAVTNKIMNKGLLINPASYFIRKAYLSALQPKWGGSLIEMQAFIEDTKKYVPKNARLETLLGYVDYTKADMLKLDKKRQKAAAYYDEALKYGDNGLYLYKRGINYYYLNKYDAALRDFNRVLEIWPQSGGALSWRSSVYKKRKMLEKALDDINLALQLSPYDSQYLRDRGFILRALKKPHQANKDFIASTYYNPYKASTWSAIGWYYQYEAKKYQKSVDAYEKAVKLDPMKAKYWYFYAGAINNVFDCERLKKALNKYLQLCSNRSQSYCESENTNWAKNSLKLLKGNKRCKHSDV